MGELERQAHKRRSVGGDYTAAVHLHQVKADLELQRQREESSRRGAEFIALALRQGIPTVTVYAEEIVTKQSTVSTLRGYESKYDVVGSLNLGRGWRLRDTDYDADTDGTAWGVVLTEHNAAYSCDGKIYATPSAETHGLPPGPCLPILAKCERGGTIEDRILPTIFAGELGMNILLRAMDKHGIQT
jgi:hypothetical protein